jgi:hypothetical protein
MAAIQRIDHDGKVVAFVVGGRAVITADLADDAFDVVRAKCLYALEVQAGEQRGPYSDRAATAYARSALGRGERRCGTPGRG